MPLSGGSLLARGAKEQKRSAEKKRGVQERKDYKKQNPYIQDRTDIPHMHSLIHTESPENLRLCLAQEVGRGKRLERLQ